MRFIIVAVIVSLLIACVCLNNAFANENALVPLIKEPRLSYINTNLGLDQDTIHSILIDSENFMWLATEEGLNRFDGASLLKVSGKHKELDSSSIYQLFEHSSGKIIIGTASSGILSLDKSSQEVITLLDPKDLDHAEWYQYVDSIIEGKKDELIVGLSHSIYSLNLETNENELLFSLTKEQYDNGVIIRTLYLTDNTLLIGTNFGLTTLDLTNKSSAFIYGNTDQSEDSFNVKLLTDSPKGELLIGTVKGLFEVSIADILKEANSDKPELKLNTILPLRNIWDLTFVDSENAYIATDLGLFELKYNELTSRFLFAPFKAYEVLSSSEITTLAHDKDGNIWFGTPKNGAMLWSPKSLLFTNIYNSLYLPDQKRLSDNIVYSVFEYDSNTLFVGTSNGLNKYTYSDGQITQFNTSQRNVGDYTDSEIIEMASTQTGFLWLNTQDGLRYYDIDTNRFAALPFKSEEINDFLEQYLYSVNFEDEDRIWLISLDGIWVFDTNPEKLTQVELDGSGIDIAEVYYFLGIDKHSNSMLLSTPSRVYGINLDDLSVTLKHSIANEGKTNFVPTQFIPADNGISWLVYAGLGLYKIDSKTFSTISKYSTDNVLTTNLIYDVKKDKEGVFWFSSHSGIHTFDETTEQSVSYNFESGLPTSEFNLGAGEKLQDGRFVYGSNLGITIFSPSEIKKATEAESDALSITNVSLSSRSISTPLTLLNDYTLNLKHDDFGLTVFVSSMAYKNKSNQTFRYTIKENKNILTSAAVNGASVSLPALKPGNYELEITSAGTDASRMYLNVAYPPFLSPFAYLIYFLLSISILSFIYIKRRKVRLVIESANAQVSEYNKRLTDALTASNSAIWSYSSEKDCIYADRVALDLKIQNNSAMSLPTYIERMHELDKPRFNKAWFSLVNKESSKLDVSYRVMSEEGIWIWYRDVGSLYSLPDGQFEIKGTYSNITSSVAAEEKLKLLGKAFTHTNDWVLIFNADKQLIATNQAVKKAFRVPSSDDEEVSNHLLLKKFPELNESTLMRLNRISVGERYKVEHTLDIFGETSTLLMDINAVANEQAPSKIDYYLIIATDISDQIKAQKELQTLAKYDPLTGLINRNLLIERLKHSITISEKHDEILAVMFIDLDRFKPINDSFGHQYGDAVLIEVANRIKNNFEEPDSVARIGGDEFVVVIEDAADLDRINKRVNNLLHELEKTIIVQNQEVSISASIGIALYPADSDDPEHLIKDADIAMFAAKEQGRNRYQYFTQSMNDEVHAQTILQGKIKNAAKNNAFTNYYQPIVNIQTGETAGYEMLMRWFDDGNFMSPSDFIPVAEQIGCIVDMTMNAIEKTIYAISDWRKKGFEGYVAINLSARHFSKRPDFDIIIKWLYTCNVPASCLRFEITEGLLVNNDVNTLEYMREMRELGFKISLDDFGTGYSSLSYVRDFPIDVLKIDRSFVMHMLKDKSTESIVRATLFMTELLGLDTVAEGVETKEELDYFKQNGCRYVQGFYFSRPLPSAEVEKTINKQWTVRDSVEFRSFVDSR
ncbi:EAL domain-containing protein [Glaciecola sp. KUL10]|uniref:EAL domain-containing protein n=1 Tax=Glaciecola sp. (strain KUL10) TaxID=2161813 RepID=UPI000D8D1D85|nr:EAL domain-containing protein [Glaciecola sp. KUL10]GBL04358.1 diguanylate cyclase/phosphodiesterase [Glaciecola sp. KUL10]